MKANSFKKALLTNCSSPFSSKMFINFNLYDKLHFVALIKNIQGSYELKIFSYWKNKLWDF